MPSNITAAAATASHGPRRFMSRKVLLRVRRGAMLSVLLSVMPGLVPGIHVFGSSIQDVDGRDKPGHDPDFTTPSCAHENTPESMRFQELLCCQRRLSPPWL